MMDAYQQKASLYHIFFFQAEDGIRDYKVTGVQTCALPISPTKNVDSSEARNTAAWAISCGSPKRLRGTFCRTRAANSSSASGVRPSRPKIGEIGRASCRERV